MTIKILLDCSAITINLFESFENSNIIDLVNSKKISFFLSDVVFYEKFIPLLTKNENAKNEQEFDRLLDYCIKYCSEKIFLPVKDIIKYEVNYNDGNKEYYFYPHLKLPNLRNKYKNFIQKRDKNYYKNLRETNKKIFELMNSAYIDENKAIIDKIKSKKDVELYLSYLIEKYNNFKLDESFFRKLINKNVPPKDNAKNLHSFVSAFLLSQNLISISSANYIKISKLFNNDNYLWTYFRVYFFTLTARVMENDIHKDKKYIDNEYITLMKDLDILIAKDKSYMRDCFYSIYANTNKEIIAPDDNLIERIKLRIKNNI